MPPILYPRLRYLLAGTGLFFLLFALLRAGFYFFSSGIRITGENAESVDLVLRTLGVGLRFDLRLAILLMLPVALLVVLPQKNTWLRLLWAWLRRLWLLVALVVIGLIYVLDFGHYAYLGLRVNGSVLRFLTDKQISADMVWQSYPVVWITLAWLTVTALVYAPFWWLERRTLNRPARVLPKALGWPLTTAAIAAMVVLGFLGILGRVSNINLKNPVPVRWSDAFFSGSTRIGALGLNPVIFLWDTLQTTADRYNLAEVRKHAPEIAAYLGAPVPTVSTLPGTALPRFDRVLPPQPHRVQLQPGQAQRRPNIVFIMMESMGGSATGLHGNPLRPTPFLDDLAKQSWYFPNFYVPVIHTAKTVWASITGIPDVTRSESATRNPFLLPQRTVINELKGYDKHYTIGGSAGWAHINALVTGSIQGVTLHQEGEWKSPNIDVWGISDLALFKETDAILGKLPRDKPFFAIIQTAGNHPPFTIPTDNDGFVPKTASDDEVKAASFRSVAQYNAVRLLDHSIGRFFDMAKKSGYYEDTIFVLYGDHNASTSGQMDYLPPAYAKLELESLLVPGIIHAPKWIKPRVTEEAASLIDLLPTVAGLAGVEYRNTTLGRDLNLPAPEGERAVPILLRGGTAFPQIGVVTRHFMLGMNTDGSDARLHDLASPTPLDNVAAQHPEEFKRLSSLTRGLYETGRLMLYSNKVDTPAAPPAKSTP